MTLATTADVEALLQSDIEPDNDPKIVAMLEMASGSIEAVLGRKAEPAETITAERHTFASTSRSSILLNRWPIASVEAVREDGTALTATDYSVDLDAGIIRRRVSGWPTNWLIGVDVVEVDYTTAEVPGLRGIAAAVVARAFKAGRAYATKPSAMEGLKQLTIGRWSATVDTAVAQQAANPLELTAGEIAAVRAYADRRP